MAAAIKGSQPINPNRRDKHSGVDAAEGIENMEVFVKRPGMALQPPPEAEALSDKYGN